MNEVYVLHYPFGVSWARQGQKHRTDLDRPRQISKNLNTLLFLLDKNLNICIKHPSPIMTSLIILVLLGISCVVLASLPAWVPGRSPLTGLSVDDDRRGVPYFASAAKQMQTMNAPSATANGQNGVIETTGKTLNLANGRNIVGNDHDEEASLRRIYLETFLPWNGVVHKNYPAILRGKYM